MKATRINRKLKKTVREGYAKIARDECSCCPSATHENSCCTETVPPSLECGNPITFASLTALVLTAF
ncbi:MAG: hypothetical protein ACUVT9_05610 [Candidatus Bathycorpusculaceae bacterium]